MDPIPWLDCGGRDEVKKYFFRNMVILYIKFKEINRLTTYMQIFCLLVYTPLTPGVGSNFTSVVFSESCLFD